MMMSEHAGTYTALLEYSPHRRTVDMMAHAIDTPAPSTIILISGDRDFVYAVSVLGLRQYRVVLLAPRAAHSSLKAQASTVYNWPDDCLPDLPPNLDETAVSRCRPATLNDFWNKRSSYPTPPSTTSTSASSEPPVQSDAPSNRTAEGDLDAQPTLEEQEGGLRYDSPVSHCQTSWSDIYSRTSQTAASVSSLYRSLPSRTWRHDAGWRADRVVHTSESTAQIRRSTLG